MFNNIIGVTVDNTLTNDESIYLIIHEERFPDTLSQVGVINYLELANDTSKNLFYCVDDGDYFTASEFRTHHGYD